MALLLDTSALPRPDCEEVLRATVSTATAGANVQLHDAGVKPRYRVEGWELGGKVSLIRAVSPEMRLIRTARHAKAGAQERVSLAFVVSGLSTLTHLGTTCGYTAGGLEVVDLSSAFDHYSGGQQSAVTFSADNDELGLSVDLVRKAVPRLRASPLYVLAQQHMRDLVEAARRTEGTPAAEMLGAATTALVRALVLTAVDDGSGGREALRDTLPDQIRHYIGLHLHEPDLTAERIAREHSISVRYLVKLWEGQDLSLAEGIMMQRLEGARRDLAAPPPAASTVAAIAQRWGFADATHFGRRFRQAYGESPREWRRRATAPSGKPPPDPDPVVSL